MKLSEEKIEQIKEAISNACCTICVFNRGADFTGKVDCRIHTNIEHCNPRIKIVDKTFEEISNIVD